MKIAPHAGFGFLAALTVLLWPALPARAEVSPEKRLALEWLNQPEVVEKFGRISDTIWSYAELGLQEHKSSALLIQTLEEAGFTVEKGPAGMPKKAGSLGQPATVFTGGASSDHGDVTLIAPTATIRFPGNASGAQGHHWSTVACGFGSSAWKGANAGAKAMAASAIDLFTQPDALRKIRQEFTAYSRKHPYKSFLPADARPPLEFYDKLMGQYRPMMEAFYGNADAGDRNRARN